jgi:hypothetical protein
LANRPIIAPSLAVAPGFALRSDDGVATTLTHPPVPGAKGFRVLRRFTAVITLDGRSRRNNSSCHRKLMAGGLFA